MSLTLGKRVALGFFATVAITFALGIFAHTRFNIIEEHATEIVRDCLPGEAIAGKIEAMANLNYARTVEHIASPNDEARLAAEQRIKKNTAEIDQLFKEYEPTITQDEDRKLFTTLQQARLEWIQGRQSAVELSNNHKSQDAMLLLTTKLGPVFDRYKQAAIALADFNKRNGQTAGKEIAAAVSSGRFTNLIGLAAALLAAVSIGFFVVRGINRILSRLASGLGQGAEQVASAASQVSSSSQSLAQGASEQAASLEETSSSLEEMSSMTKRSAESARQARTVADQTTQAATTGGQSIAKMTSAINDIQNSATETAKIIKVIDEIAFQTNLLALNAAVEAARAGEAGKGFAVVAEEVRNLAMRSAEAAKSTSALIDGSVQNARNGVSITDEVAKSFAAITDAANKVNALINEIASAADEQSQGIDQVTTAVNQMDKVTQSNAANAEESASASEELASQAEQMNDMVRQLLQLVTGHADSQQRSSTPPTVMHASRKQATRSVPPTSVAQTPAATIPLDETEEKAGKRDFSEFQKAA